ncbi:MAG: ABC-ATPase UvrA, partial [Bdellovibrionales bacterium]|nr:ABC-ATPase UvrA [Bdellovibrionales bacterium]
MKQKVESLEEAIVIKQAREHNLKNISLKIPRNKITVLTGLSGSGKSSLAFDTIYAEGQRRYIDSLSSYAKQFLEQLKKPEVDSITGLSPAIAIDQKSVGSNPRSTVGTVTEIYDFLRLLYAKVGVAECPTHKIPVSSQTPQEIVDSILKLEDGEKVYLLAPMAQGKKGEFLSEFQKWVKKGFLKAKVDGQFVDLTKAKKLAKTKVHDIDLVVDQLVLKKSIRLRLAESVNTAISLADGKVVIETTKGKRQLFSLKSACPECGYSFAEIEPRLFSFNNPRGYCPSCHGLGTLDYIEEEVFEDSESGNKKLSKVRYTLKNQKEEKDDEVLSFDPEVSICPECSGDRLKQEALNVKLLGKNISEVSRYSCAELNDFLSDVLKTLKSKDLLIAQKIIKQIQDRLNYLIRVGTGYLSMSRSSRTLSGGEAQRIRLATQVGSSLIGVLYVMDEPSIGLHPRDHHRLLEIIAELRDRGNTIILVEHDEETILYADHVVDLG